MSMSAAEKLEYFRMKNRERQKRFYDKHKDRIKENKRKDRAELKKFREEKQDVINEPYNDDDIPIVETNEPVEIIAPMVKPSSKPTKTIKIAYDLDAILKRLSSLDGVQTSTLKTYISSTKLLFRVLNNTKNLKTSLADITKTVKLINNANTAKDNTKKLSTNTQKQLFQTILYLNDKLGLNLPADTKQKYLMKFQEFNLISSDDNKERTINAMESVIPYSKYMKLVKETFENSQPLLIVNMFNEIPCRDDFDGILIKSKKDIVKDSSFNYFILPEDINKVASVYVQNFKTSKKYDPIEGDYSKHTTNLMRKFIDEENKDKKDAIIYGKHLFKEKQLSPFVSKMNDIMGLEKAKGINYLRHSKISEELSKIKSAKERIELADKFKHSPMTQLNYVRKMVD